MIKSRAITRLTLSSLTVFKGNPSNSKVTRLVAEEGGIRTPETLSSLTVFKADDCALALVSC